MTTEIIIGTEFERTNWEDLSFNPNAYGSASIPSQPTRLIVGLALDADEFGNILALADTRNNATYTITSLEELHIYLTKPSPELNLEETTGFFFYSLSDMDCLVRLLPTEAAEQLAVKRKVTVDGLQIWFSPNTKLTLRKNKRSIKIFALENLIPALDLEQAESKYLDESPLLSNLKDSPLDRAFRHQRLAQYTKHSLRSIINVRKDELRSPSAWIDADLRTAGLNIDRGSIPKEVFQEYYKGIHAPWVETFKKGYFPEAYDYDVNKAYAWAVARLINIDSYSGKWIYSQEYQPKAHYGIITCQINLRHNIVNPIFLRLNTWVASISGQFIERLTKGEIDFIKKWHLGTVRILYGYWFIPTVVESPYNATLYKRLLQYNLATTENSNPILKTVIRLMYTRIVGKFLSRVQDPETGKWITGPFFNPVYYCEAATAVKLRVAEAALRHKKSVISIATDGLLLDKPIKDYRMNPNTPGHFKLENQGPAVIVSANILQVHGKDSFFPLIDTLLDRPKDTIYEFETEDRITLCKAFKGHNLARTGQLVQEKVVVNIRSDTKRFWPRLPYTGDELLKEQFNSQVLTVEEAMIHSKFGQQRAEEQLAGLTAKLKENSWSKE